MSPNAGSLVTQRFTVIKLNRCLTNSCDNQF